MYRNILVAVDGSSTSDTALTEALELVRGQPAALRLLHVVDSPDAYPDVMFGHIAGDLEELREAWHKAGWDILDQAAARARAAGIEPQLRLLESDGRHVASTIVEEARTSGADLIVVGSHGRRGFHRLLLGSVAEGVARTAPTSVLLVRRPPAQAT
jgi:nucleotide-binding universal stress UspA family protein